MSWKDKWTQLTARARMHYYCIIQKAIKKKKKQKKTERCIQNIIPLLKIDLMLNNSRNYLVPYAYFNVKELLMWSWWIFGIGVSLCISRQVCMLTDNSKWNDPLESSTYVKWLRCVWWKGNCHCHFSAITVIWWELSAFYTLPAS